MNFFRKIFQDKKNYYNLLIIVSLGIVLLFMGDGFGAEKSSKKEVVDKQVEKGNSYEQQLETRLENILTQAQNIGKVEVMITLKNGKELITKDDTIREATKTDEEATNGDKRQTISNKAQDTAVKINGDEPLILKEINPTVSGVLIVAQGGSDVLIKSMIINATMSVLDVDINKIEVLEMK